MPDTTVNADVDAGAATTNVFTGAQFLESIQDGREIYIYTPFTPESENPWAR